MEYKALILDRDGVINADSPNYIKSPDEWIPLPGSLEAIAKVKAQGIPVGVITNQSGIGRKYYDLATLAAIHLKMHLLLSTLNTKVDSLMFCPHHPDDQCACRKPKPSLLRAMCSELSVPPSKVLYIGDKESDYRTAQAAGSHFALVRTGYGSSTKDELSQVPCFTDLAQAVESCF